MKELAAVTVTSSGNDLGYTDRVYSRLPETAYLEQVFYGYPWPEIKFGVKLPLLAIEVRLIFF